MEEVLGEVLKNPVSYEEGRQREEIRRYGQCVGSSRYKVRCYLQSLFKVVLNYKIRILRYNIIDCK